MTNLGVMYAKGQGVPNNHKKALDLLHRAAEQCSANAKYNLGAMYALAKGVPRDTDKGARLVLEALKVKDDFAIRMMKTKSSVFPAAFRRELQRLLTEEGVYSGRVDGKFGPGTKRAIEALAKKPEEKKDVTKPSATADTSTPEKSATAEALEKMPDIEGLEKIR